MRVCTCLSLPGGSMAPRVEAPFRARFGTPDPTRRLRRCARSIIDYIIRLHCCILCLLGACPPACSRPALRRAYVTPRRDWRVLRGARRALGTVGLRHACARAHALHPSPQPPSQPPRRTCHFTTKSSQVRLRAGVPRASARAGARGAVRKYARLPRARSRPTSCLCAQACRVGPSPCMPPSRCRWGCGA